MEKNKLWAIAAANLKHNYFPHILLAVGISVLTTVFFGTVGLTEAGAAIPLEMMFSMVGAVLLTPVFLPEENPQIREVLCSKYIGLYAVEVIRTICALSALVMLTLCFGIYLKIVGTEVSARLLWGAFADCLFLGSLGFLAAAVSGHTTVAYMLPVLWYALNCSLGAKLGKFYLFSMIQGNYAATPWLLFGGCVFLAAGLLYRKRM